MGWNDAYWKNKNARAALAKKHNEDMIQKYSKEIAESVECTKIYINNDNVFFSTEGNNVVNDVIVESTDTVSAILKYAIEGKKVLALNFASFKNPGGGFLKGSSAQEESLCMESTLYEVISDEKLSHFYEWNNQHKNKSLYHNRALVSPNILFERGSVKVKTDILTVAAPNRKAYFDYIVGANEDDSADALERRIRFIGDILRDETPDVVILGAFGCGVFGQNPEEVATLFKKYVNCQSIPKIVYAVIDKGGHSKEGAYAIFKRVMES